jgi:hypothetical protein
LYALVLANDTFVDVDLWMQDICVEK